MSRLSAMSLLCFQVVLNKTVTALISLRKAVKSNKK